MFNKSKVLVLSLAATATLGLVGCGQSSSSSVDDQIDVSQNSSSIAESIKNIQLIGDVKNAAGGVVACWSPDGTGAVTNPHFTRESKMLYTLKNIDMAKDSQFKFTFDDKWSGDFAGSGIDQVITTQEVLAKFDLDKDNEYKANIKVLTGGVFDFEYHPLYVAEAGHTAQIVIKAHVA